MKGFAKYLAIFSRRCGCEESSVVQSSLAKHGKLEPNRCSILCKAQANVQQKSGWSAKQQGTGTGVASRRYTRVRSCACIDESGIRNRMRGLTSCKGTKINVKSQNSKTETTGLAA